MSQSAGSEVYLYDLLINYKKSQSPLSEQTGETEQMSRPESRDKADQYECIHEFVFGPPPSV